MITMGKYRHLRRTSTADGHFVIMAIDHRTNLLEKLNQAAPEPLSDADFVAFKQAILTALAPHSSAVLTDPAYGIGAGITSGAISSGLLAPIEVTDYGLHPSERSIEYIPHWSVKKIKLVGGDGVKLLLPYHPEADNVQEKYAVVQQIIADCATYDIPFFLEPIPYALDPKSTLSNADLLRISIEMCQRFSAMGVDVLKLPFPVDTKQSQDESEWRDACHAINEACSVPWALLSAGVNYETFLRQSKIACEAGASGVIVGRAVWADVVETIGTQGREKITTLKLATKRMQELAAVCATSATAWHDIVQKPDASIHWYESYHE